MKFVTSILQTAAEFFFKVIHSENLHRAGYEIMSVGQFDNRYLWVHCGEDNQKYYFFPLILAVLKWSGFVVTEL